MSCQNCPANQIPNDVGDDCLCKEGYYDASAGWLACYNAVGEDFNELDLTRHDTVLPDSRCQECDNMCFSCSIGRVRLKENIALSEEDRASFNSTDSLSAPAAAFRCPLEGCLGSANSSQQLSTCNLGYTGALCAVCSDSYIRSSMSCDACSDTTGKSFAVAAVSIVVFLGVMIGSALVRKLKDCCEIASDTATKVGVFSELMASLKILIGLLQIVTELPSALSLNYPEQFANLLKAMKILLLDVFDMFSIDCISPVSLHAKFSMIMAMPVVGIALVHAIAIISDCFYSTGVSEEIKAARKAEIQSTKAYRSFFIIFMLCKCI